ncbi:MAG: GNAT family N-acetyltransferase [Candidatus Nanoarchaeia archaeon]|nr:GNAT family N-acetyltransferase [Candidatus Nanoarchaeia archaeon]MDD5741605.1 GNAT family N-acetyltransferase [Candidatus Nanoarchaeia archaeon]
MIIREYKPSDKKQVIELVSGILGNIFNGDPTKFEYIKEFNVSRGYIVYFVAEVEDESKKIVATMALKKVDNETVRLKRMYVHRNYRRRGIAQKMLNKIVDYAKEKGYKKMLFSSYSIMENAGRFNKKNGFVEIEGNPKEKMHLIKYF